MEGAGKGQGDRKVPQTQAMIRRRTAIVGLLIALAVATAGAPGSSELEAVKAEPDLERKARRALEFSRAQVDRVLAAYQQDDPEGGKQILAEIQEAVELAHEALMATGKPARRRPKHFKRAEIQTRRLLNQLDDLSRNLLVDERGAVDPVRERVSEINDQLLRAIMTKPKKK